MRSEDLRVVVDDLKREVSAIVPGWYEFPNGKLPAIRATANSRSHLTVDADGQLVVLIQSSDATIIAIACRPEHPLSERNLRFLNQVVRLFGSDLQTVGDLLRGREVWDALASSRFPRLIARISAFKTARFLHWLAALEVATGQTYEGRPLTGNVVFTKQLEWITGKAGTAYVPFRRHVLFEAAMQSEKWVRPLLASGELALVVMSIAKKVTGVVVCDTTLGNTSLSAPHERLGGFYKYLGPGTAVVSASEHRDIFVSLPNGLTFAKSQGTWRFQDHEALATALEARLAPAVARSALRLALNASYDRSGALLVFLEDSSKAGSVVPDHANPRRVARSLRESVSGLSILSSSDSRVIGAAARADGAVVFDRNGQVVDAACMITEPSAAMVTAAGLPTLQRFSGARTTAAWNASVSGTAIKVSEDGPIEVYSRGQSIARMG